MFNRVSIFAIAICGLGLSELSIAPPALTQPASAEIQGKRLLPDYLTLLLKAGSFDASAVGVAAVKTKNYQAFEQAMLAGESIRSEIEYILEFGTPAGQLYAVQLLLKVDPKAGKSALERLQSDQSQVLRYEGCELFVSKVSDVATELLGNRDR